MRRLQRIVRREKDDDRLSPVVDFQLSVDRREVEFYGMDSHAQATSDLSIRHTFCHQLHNLRLTGGERARWAGSVVHTMTVERRRRSIYGPNEQKPLRGRLASWLGG